MPNDAVSPPPDPDDGGPSSATDTGAGSSSPRARAVHIRFPPSQGARLRRSEPTTCGDGAPLWVERPILAQRADGTYELFGSSNNLDGVARWVLSHGTDAEVCGPDALRRRVTAEARRIARLYEHDGL